MPLLATCVAVLKSEKVLLTKRDDFEVWCLPGGAVEEGETLAQAAVRETYEETGLKIELTRLVGIYTNLQVWSHGSHTVLFAARPLSDELNLQSSEVLDARYFIQSELPDTLFWGHRQRISDALAGVGGSVAWHQKIPWPFEPGLSRKEIYARRDESGLTRSKFFEQNFSESESGEDELEVGTSD